MTCVVLKTAGTAAFALATAGCSDFCVNTVAHVTTSPDGKRDAVLFERNCGATGGFTSQISIVRRGKSPSGADNVFVADSDHGAAAPAAWGGPWVNARWLTSDRLLILFDGKARTFDMDERRGDVRIVYRKVDRKDRSPHRPDREI